ncbi:MAG: hypothetical protein QOE65_769 [Solirubrobacteraceae bacterium]|nr:hypothetical protein [Solirubrobacteraceae bacterium]
MALVMVGGLTVGLAGPSRAATLVVTKTTDADAAPVSGSCLSGVDCSLREAVTDANDDFLRPGADTVQLPPGTYTLTNNALPQIPGDVTIEGTNGATVTTITGAVTNAPVVNQAGGALSVNGASAKLMIRGVTISGNKLTGTANVGGGAIASGTSATVVIERAVLRNNRSETASSNAGAGAIAGDSGSVTITDSAVEGNVFAGTGSVAAAGGVSVSNASSVGLVVSRSSISRNRVDPASGTNSSAVGGLELNAGTALTVTDSTVSANIVSAPNGLRTGGIDTNSVPDTTLTNVTVTDNVAGAGSGFVANGISFFGAATTRVIRNSIVAGGAPLNCASMVAAITSSGGNLEDANTCNFSGPGDLINTDPQLGALRDNGGLGLSQMPLFSSPVFGLARPGFCSASDQRGVPRPQGGACDSGGVESATPPVNTTPPSIGGTPAAGQPLTCNPGAFTQAPSLAFQWLSDGAAIPGATGSTFTVTGAQLDTAIQCRVTATNIAGTSVATSAALVPPKPPAPPVNTVRPSFTGLLRTGQKLTCRPGTFVGATSSAVSWLRNGSPIGRASAAAYTLTAVDVGQAVQCRVTATGPGGSVVAESAPKVPAKACIVPTLVGKTLAAARKALTRANCALGRTRTRRSSRKPGTVLASSPAKGRNLPARAKVALTLARR